MKNLLKQIIPHYFDWLKADLEKFEIVYIHDPNLPPLHCKLPKVYINTYIGDEYGFGFLRNVIIHELYHVAIQGIYNNTEMQSIRTQFSEVHGYTADVEADLVAFVYLNKFYNVSLTDFYLAQYNGKDCFTTGKTKAKWYYHPRCLGSLLSIFYFGLTGIESTISVDLSTAPFDGMLPVIRNEYGQTKYAMVELPDLYYYQKFIAILRVEYDSFDDYFNEMTNVAMEVLERLRVLTPVHQLK